LGAKCGRPTTLLGRLACPWALFNSVFSRCILLIEISMLILWNGKIPRRKRGSLPLNPSTHLFLPHSSSKAIVHPLPYHGSLQCSVHHCRYKEDPTIERGITRQGHVVCLGRIDRPTEGLRCYKGGYWRSRHAIGEDGRQADQLPWPASWSFAPPPPVMRANHHQHAKVPLVPKAMECARFMLFPLVRRLGRSIDWSTYTCHYGDPHSEDGGHPMSICGPFEQQQRPPTGEA
jgi:hypothetical protein